MNRRLFIAFLATIACICFTLPGSFASEHERRLLRKLFYTGYDSDERPVENDEDAVVVIFGLTLNQIVDVDEKNQILTTSAWVRQIWHNPLLKWNKSEFGNLTSINVSPRMVWLPDIVLYENADEDITFGGSLERLNTRVNLNSDGKNVWLAPVTFKSKCRINVEFFPFDEQRCQMKFGSWTYDGFRVDFVNQSDTADLGNYIQSAEWKLVGAPAERNVLKYYCCEEPFPDVTFTIIIQRRSLFYMMNLILPLVIITFMVNISFVLPAESGERISLTITILLAMTVFMLVVAETIPPTSDAVPLIAKFYMAGMCEMAVGLVWTCFILKYYHSDVIEMSPWFRKYVLGYLGNFFGINMEKLTRVNEHSNMRKHLGGAAKLFNKMATSQEIMSSANRRHSSYGQHKSNQSNNNPYDTHLLRNDESLYVPSHLPLGGSFESLRTRDHQHHFSSGPLLDLGEKILEKVETLVENSVVDDHINKHKEEWRIAAMVMDKVSLWVFSITVGTTIVVCFLQAPGYVS